jgi:putative hemolysin
MDPGWRSFTARMIAKSGARVLPVYFHGHTSRLFQIASHMHMTLRLGLLINEFGKRVDAPVAVSIGTPIEPQRLLPFANDSKAMMDFLRKATYELSQDPVKSFDLGYEFEKRHRS